MSNEVSPGEVSCKQPRSVSEHFSLKRRGKKVRNRFTPSGKYHITHVRRDERRAFVCLYVDDSQQYRIGPIGGKRKQVTSTHRAIFINANETNSKKTKSNVVAMCISRACLSLAAASVTSLFTFLQALGHTTPCFVRKTESAKGAKAM